MSIPRLILVMLSALGVMLTLVILRTETVRFQYKAAKSERECDSLEQDIRERELELARIGNPVALRDRLIDLRGVEPADSPKSQPGSEKKPKPATPSKPRKP